MIDSDMSFLEVYIIVERVIISVILLVVSMSHLTTIQKARKILSTYDEI